MKSILNILSSVRITVVCLFLLFVLTFWGTVAQVDHGLYAAQERYFYSFVFLAGGVVPIPGGQLLLWILFVNLLASAVNHFSRMRGWQSIGLKLSHAGVLLYFVSAFITFHSTVESYLRLAEGDASNVSSSYHEWELAVWTKSGMPREVTAIDVTQAKPGRVLALDNISVTVQQFYLNSKAYKSSEIKDIVNVHGITLLQPQPMIKEREKNVAGGIFLINNQHVLLYGTEGRATKVGDYYFSLRHKRYPLPFLLKLKRFTAEFHAGTQMAKSYESFVEVVKPNSSPRDVRIYMNNPLREKNLTFYQASYEIDQQGREYSILAVVQSQGQILPYFACFAVFVGLAFHFIMVAFRRKRL